MKLLRSTGWIHLDKTPSGVNIKEEEIGTNQNGVKSGVNKTVYGSLTWRVQNGLEDLTVSIRRKEKVDEL